MAPVRLVLAEDDLFMREGLVSLLTASDDVIVDRAVGSLDELLAAVAEVEPDVVLTDIRMAPDCTNEGIVAARRLRNTHPHLGVVVLSAFVDPAYAIALLDDGTRGRGYVVKERVDDLNYLLRAITTVSSGGSFIDSDVVEALVRGRSRAPGTGIEVLSPRERVVLAELASGLTNAAIASSLCVSVHAVQKHVGSIFAKLGLTEDTDINKRVMAVLFYLAGGAEAPSCRAATLGQGIGVA